MKKLKLLSMMSLLMFSAIHGENNELNHKESTQERVTRITRQLTFMTENCALIDFISKRDPNKLSSLEQDIESQFRADGDLTKEIDSLTVEEYFQILKSRDDKGRTFKEIADDNAATKCDGDLCYKIARRFESHEKALLFLQSQGRGNQIFGRFT